MSSYSALAAWYDQLTGDVPYSLFADFYQTEFQHSGGKHELLLDLCCGTGTLCCEMARRGYDMIGADISVDMLTQAQKKAEGLKNQPLFICQDAAELDLYGSVDGAFCSLDGMNYIPPEDLPAVFSRLNLFIRPGGLFIFDIRSPQWLESMDGTTYVDESDGLLCLWRADMDKDGESICYGMDLFTREEELWRRSSEEHIEYVHSPENLAKLLSTAGFDNIRLPDSAPQKDLGRLFICARRADS